MLYPQVCPDPAEAAGGGAHERPAVPHPAEDTADQPGPGRGQEEGGQRHRAALPGAREGGEDHQPDVSPAEVRSPVLPSTAETRHLGQSAGTAQEQEGPARSLPSAQD